MTASNASHRTITMSAAPRIVYGMVIFASPGPSSELEMNLANGIEGWLADHLAPYRKNVGAGAASRGSCPLVLTAHVRAWVFGEKIITEAIPKIIFFI